MACGEAGGFLVYFRDESIDLAAAAHALTGYRLAVSRDGELLTVRHGRCPDFRIGLSAEPWVREEATDIGEGSPHAEFLAGCDRRFEVEFDDLDTVLDEYNTLFTVEEALQEVTGGVILLGWNGHLIGPDAYGR